MKFPYILAFNLCLTIKRALLTNHTQTLVIHTDKQIEFTTYETQLEVIKSYRKYTHVFRIPPSQGGV